TREGHGTAPDRRTPHRREAVEKPGERSEAGGQGAQHRSGRERPAPVGDPVPGPCDLRGAGVSAAVRADPEPQQQPHGRVGPELAHPACAAGGRAYLSRRPAAPAPHAARPPCPERRHNRYSRGMAASLLFSPLSATTAEYWRTDAGGDSVAVLDI